MKRTVKLTLVSIALLLVIYLSINFFNVPDTTRKLSVNVEKNNKENTSDVNIPLKEIRITGVTDIALMNEVELENKFKAIIKNFKTLSYEDDWCFSNFELTPEDKKYHESQREEFLISRGVVNIFRIPEGEKEPVRVDSHLDSYTYMSLDELSELASQRDRLALTEIMKRGITSQTEQILKIARVALALGDTQQSLIILLQSHLSDISIEFSKTKKVNESIMNNLIASLSLVEIGLKRKELRALSFFLSYESNTFKSKGLDLNIIINDEVEKAVKAATQIIWESLDALRMKEGLPLFSQEEPSKIAINLFESRLATMKSFTHENINNSIMLKCGVMNT